MVIVAVILVFGLGLVDNGDIGMTYDVEFGVLCFDQKFPLRIVRVVEVSGDDDSVLSNSILDAVDLRV